MRAVNGKLIIQLEWPYGTVITTKLSRSTVLLTHAVFVFIIDVFMSSVT